MYNQYHPLQRKIKSMKGFLQSAHVRLNQKPVWDFSTTLPDLTRASRSDDGKVSARSKKFLPPTTIGHTTGTPIYNDDLSQSHADQNR